MSAAIQANTVPWSRSASFQHDAVGPGLLRGPACFLLCAKQSGAECTAYCGDVKGSAANCSVGPSETPKLAQHSYNNTCIEQAAADAPHSPHAKLLSHTRMQGTHTARQHTHALLCRTGSLSTCHSSAQQLHCVDRTRQADETRWEVSSIHRSHIHHVHVRLYAPLQLRCFVVT